MLKLNNVETDDIGKVKNPLLLWLRFGQTQLTHHLLLVEKKEGAISNDMNVPEGKETKGSEVQPM